MSEVSQVAGLILAAGKGTRMKSELPKCLHEVCGVPMVEMVISALAEVGVSRPVIVVGHGADQMREVLGDRYEFATQEQQLGTGHAVLMAKDQFIGFQGSIVVACGDTPMLRSSTIKALVDQKNATGAEASMAVVSAKDPSGYGRIERDADGNVLRIVEEKDIKPEEAHLKQINEINPALYCFDAKTLFDLLPDKPSDTTGEFYLTDVIGRIRENGGKVSAVVFHDEDEFQGVNDRWQLAKAAKTLRMRILEGHAKNGVTIVDPDSTFITPGVKIEPDTTIQPMTVIEGTTTIGTGCSIGPNTWIKDATIGNSVRVFMSHIDQATMRDGSRCGPFANLRPDAELGEKVKIGNFVEIKNAKIGPNTSISHLTYIGDASVGSGTNIGAGTITCNYDGFNKHKTVIGDDVFIGSNSTLVAPLNIGNGSMTAAGSVVTRDTPDNSMAIGRARQENKEEWAKIWRDHKKSAKEQS